jgi:hypothetical protein
LFPGTICPIIETARSTALPVRVEKTAIRCTSSSAAQPFIVDGIMPVATTPRKITAQAPRQEGHGR